MEGEARWSGLDGLRALAVVAVLGTHFAILNQGAAVGVDLFFVLSGFLITSLLLRERQRAGAISLRRFWLRRGLRLFPALFCAVLFALVVAQWATPEERHATMAGLPWVFLYLGNWAKAAGGPHTLGLLVHTWSLAVEEQFYILWPLVMTFWLSTRARLPRAASVMASLAVVAGLYNLWAMEHWGGAVADFRTDTHAMGLCAGSALALALKGRPESVSLSTRGRWLIQVTALGAFALFCVVCVSPVNTPQAASMMLNAATLCSVALVAYVVLVPANAWVRLLSGRGPSWLGARSYGIYLYHYPLALVVMQAHIFHGAEHSLAVVTCLLITLVVAAASYRWIETPFLRLKQRLSVATEPAPAPAPQQSQLAAT
jgi:peptidoglycan/LPS O-acetylase OafA/YrhL